MSDTSICLKPVNDLLGKPFLVPSYQRGYRWTKTQVNELLDDIWEFQTNSENGPKASFYCLQPIVVRPLDRGRWELVDGQQRLTTIYLILTYLQQILDLLGKERFTLSFETRGETSGEFLKNIDKSQRDCNIDFHHICNAYDAIALWFEGRDGNHKLRFLQCLLNDDGVGRNVRVIWYELPKSENAVDVFTRLNVGKIPLTDAELIRALFLRAGNFDAELVSLQQLKTAAEWDAIEKALQSDRMWCFLHRTPDAPPSRISYIYELIVRESCQRPLNGDDHYTAFHFYNDRLASEGVKAETEWLRVKQYFMTLEEWFNDDVLYHLIGFLVHEGEELLSIRRLGSKAQKIAFDRLLRNRIYSRLFGNELTADTATVESRIKAVLSELDYEDDAPRIRSVLLLFNIATLLQNPNANLRFPFDRFKKESWDLEHIRAVASGKPPVKHRQRWLEHVSEYLSTSDEERHKHLANEIRSLLASQNWTDEGGFDKLYERILDELDAATESEADHGVGNLTILDTATNRGYKNAPFAVKRKWVLGLDQAGTFLPLCTKNVFLKCYSETTHQMFSWQPCDRDSYTNAIFDVLTKFFCGQPGAQS